MSIVTDSISGDINNSLRFYASGLQTLTKELLANTNQEGSSELIYAIRNTFSSFIETRNRIKAIIKEKFLIDRDYSLDHLLEIVDYLDLLISEFKSQNEELQASERLQGLYTYKQKIQELISKDMLEYVRTTYSINPYYTIDSTTFTERTEEKPKFMDEVERLNFNNYILGQHQKPVYESVYKIMDRYGPRVNIDLSRVLRKISLNKLIQKQKILFDIKSKFAIDLETEPVLNPLESIDFFINPVASIPNVIENFSDSYSREWCLYYGKASVEMLKELYQHSFNAGWAEIRRVYQYLEDLGFVNFNWLKDKKFEAEFNNPELNNVLFAIKDKWGFLKNYIERCSTIPQESEISAPFELWLRTKKYKTLARTKLIKSRIKRLYKIDYDYDLSWLINCFDILDFIISDIPNKFLAIESKAEKNISQKKEFAEMLFAFDEDFLYLKSLIKKEILESFKLKYSIVIPTFNELEELEGKLMPHARSLINGEINEELKSKILFCQQHIYQSFEKLWMDYGSQIEFSLSCLNKNIGIGAKNNFFNKCNSALREKFLLKSANSCINYSEFYSIFEYFDLQINPQLATFSFNHDLSCNYVNSVVDNFKKEYGNGIEKEIRIYFFYTVLLENLIAIKTLNYVYHQEGKYLDTKNFKYEKALEIATLEEDYQTKKFRDLCRLGDNSLWIY